MALTVTGWTEETVDSVYAKAKAINADLKDYQADISIALKAKLSFIPYDSNLVGKYLHKRPDKHRLDLDNAPSYLKKYPHVFGFNLPILSRYKVLRMHETELKGQPVYKIQLIPKVTAGDITNVDLYINRENYTVPKYDTFYKKGHLYVDIQFRRDQGYWVYDSMDADFEFPSINAQAKAVYSNYVYNQNLADSLFKQKK